MTASVRVEPGGGGEPSDPGPVAGRRRSVGRRPGRSGRRAGGTLLALVAALALALLAPLAAPSGQGPAVPFAAPAARGAATDLTLVTHAVYTVRPEASRVSVSVAIEARNRTRETKTRRFWFDHGFLAVQPGAANVRLTGAKGARARVVRETARATLLRLDFGARLYSGRTARLRLSFDLPGAGRAASPDVRVGSALVTLPVWAFASTGARGSTVSVRVPGGWDVAVESGNLSRRDGAGGGTVLTSGPIRSPLRWFAYVTAQRPPDFAEREVAIAAGDRDAALVLRGWPDDPAWSERVESQFADALPILREDIGVAWPLDEPLVIAESVSRDADAYAGWFDPSEGRMEIAYWAGREVIVHQAAHGWFNGGLLADRWANEGFATHYALRALAALGEPAAPPELTDELRADAVPLAAWPGATGAPTAQDAYGAAASAAVAAAIAEAVGPEVLQRVWADAAAGTGAYQPPAEPATTDGRDAATAEEVAGPPDWRGFLDLLEAHSGQDLAPLWREWIVDADGAALLDARSAAREAYARTLRIAGDWQLPRGIRDALRAWDFETAQSLMADARTVLAQRGALAELGERAGLALPDEMRPLFERGELADASARAEAEQNAILAIGRAESARSAVDDPLSRLGMWGEHPEADLDGAREALATGDLERAVEASDRAWRAWTVAFDEGRRRALLALAAVATVLVLGSALLNQWLRSRRTARSRPGGPAGPAPADDGIAAA